MSARRIAEVLDAYRQAAHRAREAGFDGVELQLGLGYLPAQFLSARTNLREDGYGATREGRWRFVSELMAGVRAAIGRRMAIVARISADEKVEGGLGLEDAVLLARRLESRGIHALHVVTGSACDSPPWYYQHMSLPTHVNESLATAVRNAVSVPVIAAGRLGGADRIRSLLGEGLVDVIALGRPLVADPDLPRKMREGRDEDIIACGSCLQGCLAKVKAGGPIGCIVNPEIGHEADPIPPDAGAAMRLAVVGGGPAGMTAALTAHRAGAQVTLLERRGSLGGQFSLAPLTEGKGAMGKPLLSLIDAVERSGVEIQTGVEATVDSMADLNPDHTIVATGSSPSRPLIPGLDEVLTAEQILRGEREAGQRVLILGGGLVGIEMAEHLALDNREVVVVELLEDTARDMEAIARKMTVKRLQELPVTIHTSTRLVRMDGGEAIVDAAEGGNERSIGGFDSVLVAVGHQPYDPLSKDLSAAGWPVTVIGDAYQPGQIFDATDAGRRAVEAVLRATRESS
jgi:NADPH-dependent 2,4-dienoyl-CoA reductase/sulfur reductase-like enzyme